VTCLRRPGSLSAPVVPVERHPLSTLEYFSWPLVVRCWLLSLSLSSHCQPRPNGERGAELMSVG
jgi:hypothetical protein